MTDSAEGQAGKFQAGDPLPTSLESFGERIQATELGMFRSRVSNGDVLDCNERIAEILGYESREDCLERYGFDLHCGSTASRMQVIELLADEASHALEIEARRVDGDTVWLEVRAGQELPAFAISVTGLEQALGNLIANAVQASCSGDVVRVCFDGDESEVRTRVIDRGHGMEADHAARVFDPFFTTRQIEGGSGLGLSIAHGIIEQHRGTISVNSTTGEGTTMCVVLPIAS